MGDLWLCLTKCMSSWRAIQFQMCCIIAWCIVQMSLSIYYQQNDGGLFSGLHHTTSNVTTTPYKNWDSSVCTASPYIYIKPFAFTYSSASSLVGDSGTTLTYCGFPDSNSIFRIVITVIGGCTVGWLFMNTIVSIFARYIFIIYAFLFFAALVLDANAVTTGLSLCNSSFTNTGLLSFIRENQLSLTCSSGGYTAVTVIDLVICIQFFFIATAWVFCTNKYPKKETSAGEAVEDAQHKSKSGSKSKGHKTKSKPLPQIDDDDII